MNTSLFFRILTITSAILSVIPFTIAIINIKSIQKYLIMLFLLMMANVIMEFLNIGFSEFGYSNLYIYHYFTVIEFAFISLFYALFFKKYFNTMFIYFLIPAFLGVAYTDYKINGLNSMDNFSTSVESIILIFYSLFFFYYVLKNLVLENLLSTPVFWLNTAILFYFSGNMILFVFSNHMAKTDNAKYIILWAIIHTFFNVIYNTLLSLGFWKVRLR